MSTVRKLGRFRFNHSHFIRPAVPTICTSSAIVTPSSARLMVHNILSKTILHYCTNVTHIAQEINSSYFEKVCAETLESLTDFFEELVENRSGLESADVCFNVSLILLTLLLKQNLQRDKSIALGSGIY